jgi:hypothetical protein
VNSYQPVLDFVFDALIWEGCGGRNRSVYNSLSTNSLGQRWGRIRLLYTSLLISGHVFTMPPLIEKIQRERERDNLSFRRPLVCAIKSSYSTFAVRAMAIDRYSLISELVLFYVLLNLVALLIIKDLLLPRSTILNSQE